MLEEPLVLQRFPTTGQRKLSRGSLRTEGRQPLRAKASQPGRTISPPMERPPEQAEGCPSKGGVVGGMNRLPRATTGSRRSRRCLPNLARDTASCVGLWMLTGPGAFWSQRCGRLARRLACVRSRKHRRVLAWGRLLSARRFLERSRYHQSDCRDDGEQGHASRSRKTRCTDHE